ERRQRVEAKALGVVEHGSCTESLADVAEHRVDRVLEACRQVDVAERLGRFGIAGVADLLAVLLAIARVVERRIRREAPRVERGGGSDHLERRARRVLAGGRTVEKRRAARGICARRDAKPFLDQIWVVSRIGGHHEHPPRRWVERDNRTALAAQQPPGQSLRTWPDGQHEVVTGY